MNQTRMMLAIVVFFLGWMLYSAWQQDYARPAPPAPAADVAATSAAPTAQEALSALDAAAVPEVGAAPAVDAAAAPLAAPLPAAPEPSDAAAEVVVETDVLRVVFSARGASIIRAELKAYTESLDSETPIRLLDDGAADFYVAQSGLVSRDSPAPNHTSLFTTDASAYSLRENEDELAVDFRWHDAGGVEVVKTWTFRRGSYLVDLRQRVINHSGAQWQGFAYRQLQRVMPPKPEGNFFFAFSDPSRYSFTGGGWYSDTDKFSKIAFDEFVGKNGRPGLDAQVQGGWLAMLQHYFFAAWIPPGGETERYTSAVLDREGNPRYLLRATSPGFSVAPGATADAGAQLFMGPKLASLLKETAPHLELAVDYGKLTILSKPLHGILALFHRWTGNWGVAIILLLLLIKAVFFKLSEAQYRSMAKMRKLSPKVKALRERYADDKQKQQQAMMELYKKEKANPMAGCLPMLVQFPVFIALYWMLMQSVDLRQAPFFGWIQDLSAPDPWFILPALNGLLMLAQQLLTPVTGMDPTQAKMMKFMPVAFAFFFAVFPAGLVLYYCTNTLVSVAQMWIIMRRFEAQEKQAAA